MTSCRPSLPFHLVDLLSHFTVDLPSHFTVDLQVRDSVGVFSL
jgi:hypothetical protein